MSVQLLTTIDREGFGNDSHTEFLIRSNTFNGDTVFTDDGNLGLTMSRYGTPVHSTALPKFGKTSIRLNGTGYVYAAYNAVFDFQAGMNFTLDFWTYVDTVSIIQVIAELFVGQSGNGWTMYSNYGGINIYSGGGFMGASGVFLTPNTWYHIAWVQKAGIGSKLFKDGKEIATSSAYPIPCGGGEQLCLGGRDAGPSYLWTGGLDEVRVSNMARWWEDFNPPNRSYGR